MAKRAELAQFASLGDAARAVAQEDIPQPSLRREVVRVEGVALEAQAADRARVRADAEGVTRFTTEIIAREMKMLGGGERTDIPVPPEDGQEPPPSDDVPF